MKKTEKAQADDVCHKCGDRGYLEYLLRCPRCKIREHCYCTMDHPHVPEGWICDVCRESKKTMLQLSKSMPFNKAKENAKVKFISPEEVYPLTQGYKKAASTCMKGSSVAILPRIGNTVNEAILTSKEIPRRCIKTSNISSPDNFQSLRTDNETSFTGLCLKASMNLKSNSTVGTFQPASVGSQVESADLPIQDLYTNDKGWMRANSTVGVCMDIQCRETGMQENVLLPPPPLLISLNGNDIQWRGCFVVKDIGEHIYEDIRAHFPRTISMKAYNALRSLPNKLQFTLNNRVDNWPIVFHIEPPSHHDVALYFLPSESDRRKEKYARLLERIEKNDLAMCSYLNGSELLIYSSKLLPLDVADIHDRLESNLYLWGIFRHFRSKLNQDTRVHGNGSQVDMDINLVGGGYVGTVDRVVAKPNTMQRVQLIEGLSASDKVGDSISNSSTLLEVKNDSQETLVPPGFSKPSKEGLACGKKPLVKFALKKPGRHIRSVVPAAFSESGLHNLKCGSGLSAATRENETTIKSKRSEERIARPGEVPRKVHSSKGMSPFSDATGQGRI